MNSNLFIVQHPVLPPAINVTEQFLRDVGHDQATLRELFEHALNDIPDPLHPGQLLTYGQVLADAEQPIGTERANAYARAQGYAFPLAPEAYAQQQFDEARGRFLARACHQPAVLAFSADALAAFAASRNHRMQPGEVLSPDVLRQFFQPQPVAVPGQFRSRQVR